MQPWVLNQGSALLIVAIIMWLSDIVGTATKAKVPGTFVLSLILLVGWWTVLPQDLLDISGVTALASFVRYYIMVQIGTLFDPKELLREWKTVVTTLSAVVGIIIMVYGIGHFIMEPNIALAMTPPLTGGVMAMMLMSDAATALGRTDVATVAVLACVLQGFMGMPGASFCLSKAGKPMLEQYRAGTFVAEGAKEGVESKPKLIEKIPKKYRSGNYYITTLIFFAMLSMMLASFCATHGLKLINSSITGIIVGILASALGLIEKDPQGKAQMAGYSNFVLMPSLLGSLRTATPKLVAGLIVPLLIGFALALIGVVVTSFVVGTSKPVGFNKYIAVACGLNCFLGFPPNYYVTMETINTLTDDETERKFLVDQLLPKMIIASITAVSVVSVLIAGVMVNMIK
ncbi:hypothetical protein SDC9_86409 [bioreactor metagenome]|uniref:Na+/glutamate symporter n=1 Tax=bioreactor metagenome TaxID=1076179 RepID=A0A644ZQ84_9ZZZZ